MVGVTYSLWQRGSNENINDLIRQHLPRGTGLSVHSQEEPDATALQLNMCPRKRFDFKEGLKKLALGKVPPTTMRVTGQRFREAGAFSVFP